MEPKAYEATTLFKNTFKAGDVLNNKWIILEFIDKGGMGEVYRAHQINLNRDVAIKVISREWIESIDEDDEEAETLVQRFRREVQAMAQMSHPNVLQIFDHDSITVKKGDQDTSMEYIAMEYIPGGSLREIMSEEGFYPDEIAAKSWIRQYFMPVLTGVQALHDYGIVHRDLKPENILIDNGAPKIADFGLARSSRLKPVTQSMDIKGSPHYMSPEHFFDFKRADQRADIYSLGKILFEVVEGKIKSGTTPFRHAKLESPESPVFRKLDQIIQQATAESREERTQSVEDLRHQLEQVVNTPVSEPRKPIAETTRANAAFLYTRPKWIWTGVVVATLSVLLMTLWHIMGQPGLNSTKGIYSTSGGGHKSAIESNNEAGIEKIDRTGPAFFSEHIGKQHLVPGGEFVLPPTSGRNNDRTVQVGAFYMDEFLVTNQQFVDFLNHNLPRIIIDNKVVQGDGSNWLFLGEVHADHEPISYRNNEFHISDPAYASSPVLRVTGYGAAAFAGFYSRRLPTGVELLYAIIKGGNNPQQYAQGTSQKSTKMSQEHMRDMMGNWNQGDWNKMEQWPMESWKNVPPDTQVNPSEMTLSGAAYKPNKLGIRGLNAGIGEWGLTDRQEVSDGSRVNRYAVVGGVGGAPARGNSFPKVIARLPFEGFEEIGFRTVKSISNRDLKKKVR